VFDVSGKETYAPGKGYHGSPILPSWAICYD
jgi:hypothetical protein